MQIDDCAWRSGVLDSATNSSTRSCGSDLAPPRLTAPDERGPKARITHHAFAQTRADREDLRSRSTLDPAARERKGDFGGVRTWVVGGEDQRTLMPAR